MPVGTPKGNQRRSGAGTHIHTIPSAHCRAAQRGAGARPRSTPRTLCRPQSLYRVHVHSHVHNAGVAFTHALQRGIQVVQHTTAMDEAHGVHAQPSLALRLRGHGRGGGRERQGHRRSSGARRSTTGVRDRSSEGKASDAAHLEDFHHATHGQGLLHEHACLHIPHGSAAVPQGNESRRGSVA